MWWFMWREILKLQSRILYIVLLISNYCFWLPVSYISAWTCSDEVNEEHHWTDLNGLAHCQWSDPAFQFCYLCYLVSYLNFSWHGVFVSRGSPVYIKKDQKYTDKSFPKVKILIYRWKFKAEIIYCLQTSFLLSA